MKGRIVSSSSSRKRSRTSSSSKSTTRNTNKDDWIQITVSCRPSLSNPKKFVYEYNRLKMTSITDLIHCILQQYSNRNDDSSNWNLYLGTKGPTNINHTLILEDLDEIQDGDRIVLAKNDKHNPTNRITTNLQEDDTHHQHEMSSTDSEYDEDESDTSSIMDVTNEYRDNHQTTKVKEDDDDSSIEDVTDYYQKIKQKQMNDLIQQAHVIQDDERKKKQTTPSKKQRTSSKTKKKKNKQTSCIHISPIQVIMKEKDIPIAPGCPQTSSNEEEKNGEPFDKSHTILHNNNTEKMNESIKNRILKLLNTGFHENSNENEAKNAMRLAQRLMQRHNINQALLLQEYKDKNANNVDGNDEILKGGLVTVELYHNNTTSTPKKNNKGRRRKPMSSMIRWIAYLIYPVRLNFKVEAYKTVSRNPPQCSVTFYGIYTNAQLAAYAFKIACERIATMVASYTPTTTTNNNTASFTKKARLSYGLGIVEGLTKDVESNQQKEELRRQEKLKKARDAVQKGEAHDESSDDDDDDDEYSSSFGTVSNFNSNKNNDEEEEEEEKAKVRLKVLEQEESAALALINHHERIAKDILKESNIKVYKASKRRALKFDSQSYQRGIEDSKEIDLDQRAIRGNSQVVKEELRSKRNNTKIPF